MGVNTRVLNSKEERKAEIQIAFNNFICSRSTVKGTSKITKKGGRK